MADSTIEEAIYSILANHAGTSALASTRIYPLAAPDKPTSPYIVYQQVSGVREPAMDGVNAYVSSTWQISCWATTAGAARRLAKQVRIAMNAYNATVSSRQIRFCALTNEIDLYSDVAGTNLLRKYGKALTFQINFDEATN